MYILGKRADKLEIEDIKRLVENGIQENQSLDYKKDLNFSNDKDKKEFLFDVTSMSNTVGGCLIYGIEEKKDEKGQNTGTPEKIVGISILNYDKLVQQIEDTIKTSTEPSISNIIIHRIVVDEMNVLVLGIPKNFGLPIMVTYSGTDKFYRRRNSGKYKVDVYELNQMFLQNQVLKEAAENYKIERINKILNLRAFPLLETNSSLFIHIMPYSFQNDQSIDLSDSKNMNLQMLPLFSGGYDTMYNSDGFASYDLRAATQKIAAFDQIFRNGIYEAYSGIFIEHYNPTTQVNLSRIVGTDHVRIVLAKIKSAFGILNLFKVEPPFVVSISMFGIQGAVIHHNSSWSNEFMTHEIYFPAIIIPNYESDLKQLFKPNFDILWQAAGYAKCPDLI